MVLLHLTRFFLLASLYGLRPVLAIHIQSGATVNLAPVCITTEEKSGHPGPTDVFFLSDTTGSMGEEIASVRAGASDIMNSINAFVGSGVRFGVGQYKDGNGCDAFGFRADLSLTTDIAAAQSAINTWSAAGGCDLPESSLISLWTIADDVDPAIGWRTDATRIIVWFGDAPAKDPDMGKTLADAIARLTRPDLPIKVLAIDVGALNSDGKAQQIATATKGAYKPFSGGSTLAKFIEEELIAVLKATIDLKATVTCNDAATASLSFPPAQLEFSTFETGTEVCFNPFITARANVQCNILATDCSYSIVAGDGSVKLGPTTLDIIVDPIADTTAPVLVGVPTPSVIQAQCKPPLAPLVTASDNCDGCNLEVKFEENKVQGSCPYRFDLTRTWSAVDASHNIASANQLIHVVDTLPPVLDETKSYNPCLWPPNHKYYYFPDLKIFNQVTDGCGGAVSVEFISCVSKQEEDKKNGRKLLGLSGRGGKQNDNDGWKDDDDKEGKDDKKNKEDCEDQTGHHEKGPDCYMDHGILKVRADRSGKSKNPRTYTVTLKHKDECGNAILSTNTITVPHDWGKKVGKESCLIATHKK